MGRVSYFAILALPAICHAGVDFAPHWGFSTPPHYFSGTNCRANYVASVNGTTQYMVYAKMEINGILVSEEHFNPIPGGLNEADAHAAVMFDSTQLPTGTTAEVKFTVTTDDGTYSHSYFVPVWNQYRGWSICENPTGPHWPNAAASAGQFALGYQVSSNYHNSWDKNLFLNSLKDVNYVVASAHGNPDVHNTDSTGLVHWSDYESVRVTQIGTGCPPYNSTNTPPVNFLHLLACNCGDTNNFIRACFPYMNAYGAWLENQCVLAYNVSINVWDSGDMAELVSGAMAYGFSVGMAKALFKDKDYRVWDDGAEHSRAIRVGDVAVYGDPHIRMSGVYTADTGVSTVFSRQLP